MLEARNRVERDANGYRAGVGLVFGAHAYLTSSPLLIAARSILQDLAAETGLTASLFKRLKWARVVLARVDGTQPLRYELPIGQRLPLHLGAGKVLAAHLSPSELDDFLDQLGEHTRADGTKVNRDDFVAELKHITDVGYSQARGEREPGVASVAAPINDPAGITAGVQVAGAIDDIPVERVEQLGVEVQRAAFAIARQAL